MSINFEQYQPDPFEHTQPALPPNIINDIKQQQVENKVDQ
jgi:hypothetical protein